MRMMRFYSTACLLLFTSPGFADELELRGNVALQTELYTANSDHREAMQRSNASVSGEVEFYKGLGDGDRNIVVTPFLRIDQGDRERTHFDFREFLYQQNSDNWELRLGLGKVFWGVAESRNVVDIINQTDAVEGITTNEKLGQPMVHLTRLTEKGDFELFVMPGFRERTLTGSDGRPRPVLPFALGNATYEDSSEESHVDFALRYTNAIEEWDIGISVFQGTSRDPLFRFNQADLTLRPFYYQVQQFGLDLQATLESWLLKLELIQRNGDEIENHAEAVAGFEYSFYSVLETDTDIGIVAEYLYDEMGEDAYHPLQNDILVGIRFALNDEQSTDALIGVISDLDGGAQTFSIEANRRIGSEFKLTLDAVLWTNTSDDEQLDALRNEDYVSATVAWFF